jgi:hypothetical protein
MFGHIDYSREWDMSRITGNPEVTGPEVGFEEMAIDLRQAVSG